MSKIGISEGTETFAVIKREWQEKAKACTVETLPVFIKELTENYGHDYGTICHAMAMAAVASCWAIDHSPTGGITGFQAGAVMWQFIREWNKSGNKTGLKLVDYDNFLYPQYADKFDKLIEQDTWSAIKKEAGAQIEKADSSYAKYLRKSEQYEIDIAAFIAKFPDYTDRREHYDPLGMGTGDQGENERIKKESGFEFAPQAPYKPIHKGDRVYEHWVSIVRGVIPFGYGIEP